MDLLYIGRFSSFCLVSSDSDFTRLAARIREQGVTVYGFCERKTNNAFIAACHKFIYFDVLNVPEEPDHSAVRILQPRLATTPQSFTNSQSLGVNELPKRPIDQVALTGLANAVNNSVGYEDDWANLAEVGHYLGKISPDLNARNYGYTRLREFVEASGIMDLKWKDMGDKPRICLVRLKKKALTYEPNLQLLRYCIDTLDIQLFATLFNRRKEYPINRIMYNRGLD
ncbi:hypothetical protein FKW77_000156 [Venturia effusa]|uniref:HTH OST-type domain-containing protein n=1 Tax=Venturia effusa TaxID=50376 RepID=A0A517LQD1_9PEZI|nr:hypothetical protein FKW77_000156 [Venturia effusa]